MSFYSSPFQPIRNSTSPAFNSSAFGATSHFYALESTAIREWQYPTNRTIRLASISGDDFYFQLGSTLTLAESSNSSLVLGGTVELFSVQAGQTHIAFASSTNVTVNVTLGTGNP